MDEYDGYDFERYEDDLYAHECNEVAQDNELDDFEPDEDGDMCDDFEAFEDE